MNIASEVTLLRYGSVPVSMMVNPRDMAKFEACMRLMDLIRALFRLRVSRVIGFSGGGRRRSAL